MRRGDARAGREGARLQRDRRRSGTTRSRSVAPRSSSAGANGFAVEATEDATQFTDAKLAQFNAVILLSTTGDVLDAAQQTAFEGYIRAGGGYVGIHAASDTEYDWAWYGSLVGAYFESHPANQNATVKVADRTHPSTAGLPQRWHRTDEWYYYRTNPRGQVHVLATLDETTYTGGVDGADHPIAWCQRLRRRPLLVHRRRPHERVATPRPNFRHHLLGGIR